MKKQNTRRAFLMSLLSLLLCASMLVGTTFAWFTDTVVSSGNIIKSGKLQVTMSWADGAKDVPAATSADWKNAESGPMFTSDTKWEPGYTDAKHIRIANVGNLALKYNIQIKANGTVSDLADVIDVYVINPAAKVAGRQALTTLTPVGTLSQVLKGIEVNSADVLEEGDAKELTLVMKMQETAGNEYQEKAIGTDFSVILYATQYTSESDSFDKYYDSNALPCDVLAAPATAQSIIESADEGTVIGLAAGTYGDLVMKNADGSAKKNITLMGANGAVAASVNMNGSTYITLDNLTFDASKGTTVWSSSNTGHVITASGSKASITDATEARAYNGAQNIVIKNCTFTDTPGVQSMVAGAEYFCIMTGTTRKSQSNMNYTVENCTFACDAKQYIAFNNINGEIVVRGNVFGGAGYGTEHNNINATSSGANWTIEGNTFNNWNPLKAAIGTSRSSIGGVVTWKVIGNTFNNDAGSVVLAPKARDGIRPDAYKADNTKVIFEGNKALGGMGTLTATTRNAENDEDIFCGQKIADSDATYASDSAELKAAAGIKNETVYLTAGTYDSVSLANGVTLIGQEGTVIKQTTGNAALGSTHGTTIKNVTFTGTNAQRWGYASGTVVFENCTFEGEGTGSLSWAIHYDDPSGADILYKNCKIIGWVAIGSGAKSLTFDGCEFYGNGEFGLVRSYSDFTMKNCKFDFSAVSTTDSRSDGVEVLYGTVTLENCTNLNGSIYDAISTMYFDSSYEATAVIVDGTYMVGSDKMLKTAISAGAKNYYLVDGEYVMSTSTGNGAVIEGESAEGTVIEYTVQHSGLKQGSIWQKTHFKNVSFKNTVFTAKDGGNSSFTGVNFKGGFRRGYGNGVVFTDCTFGTNSEGYALHFESDAGSTGEIKLNGCTFEGGKVHLGGKRTYNFKGCEFAENTDLQVWGTVILDGCTVKGTAVTSSNVSTLFPNLNTAVATVK